ncbi:MAG TPA: MBOAT family protein [Deltaproteobacteria bacterium]|nr:MBOAT family protein [Deltaproteobacteria bacterium]
MNFTSIIYLPFLVITLVLFHAFKGQTSARNWLLLVASYLFYAWWDVRFLSLIIIISLTNYLAGRMIHESEETSGRRWFLIVSIVVSLGILGYFKYCNFFIETFVTLMDHAGIGIKVSTLNILLPLGISFYTFQAMTYTLDIYRGAMKPTDSALKFFTYVAFFPKLLVGPIARARDMLPQFDSVETNSLQEEGLVRIMYGLCKKLLLADVLGRLIVGPAFADPQVYKGLPMLLAVYGYTFQIFLDFSAYTDIAIGSAQLFGFRLPQNFRSPYLAADPRDFWRRWHITFSSWLRDYLYISLGGNRKGRLRSYLNITITFFLGGLWHGAGMNFIIWGLLHAFYDIVYRLESVHAFMQKMPRMIRVVFFFHLVAFAWIFFRLPSLEQVSLVLSCMDPGAVLLSPAHYGLALKTTAILALSLVIHNVFEPRIERLGVLYSGLPAYARGAVMYVFSLLLYYASELSYLHSNFIYFQF